MFNNEYGQREQAIDVAIEQRLNIRLTTTYMQLSMQLPMYVDSRETYTQVFVIDSGGARVL